MSDAKRALPILMTRFEWYPAGSKTPAICDVAIYDGAGVFRGDKIVVLTEPAGNNGMSVTNGFEQIATKIVKSLPRVFDPFRLESITWLEHYPAELRGDDGESFDRVFVTATTVGFRSADWRPANRHIAESFIGGDFVYDPELYKAGIEVTGEN